MARRFTDQRVTAIQSAICNYFGIKMTDLLGKRRKRGLVHPRQLAIYLCRFNTELSLPEIARHFERDHTTIGHAIKNMTKLLTKNHPLINAHNVIKSEVLPFAIPSLL